MLHLVKFRGISSPLHVTLPGDHRIVGFFPYLLWCGGSFLDQQETSHGPTGFTKLVGSLDIVGSWLPCVKERKGKEK